ncbi:peptidoglycan-binding protein [Kaistia dalseonensis]|uniref:Lysozyme n=1 Tax=Kaistia dalseonensis TaxID=410840 RepID=A0ABU0H018_9HYPH|nr:peptidoglycan-binding protein [Kaistia dalseonensis]MCX5493091.1 peptidoglycan-binding protein [Kaistia dalseonensis]MDQ0435646.1 lysozyme [Kaistia dalseonensis]
MARTSAAGLRQLVAEEGEVLRAYRDIAGVWTIGVGLTRASGVVVPVAGMVISREESARLLALALQKNYEPAVDEAMPGASAAAFDGGMSFHFNTGAIARAGWVEAWRRGDGAAVRSRLMAWSKAGGRTVEGLRRRREREADLIVNGHYAADAAPAALAHGQTGEAVRALQQDLIRLGLLEGAADGVFGAATEAAVRRFQRAHPDLTVDGLAGRATRAAIARALAARNRLATIALGGAVAGAAPVVAEGMLQPSAGLPDPVPAGPVLASPLLVLALVAGAVALVALAITGWRYRDDLRSLFNARRKD